MHVGPVDSEPLVGVPHIRGNQMVVGCSPWSAKSPDGQATLAPDRIEHSEERLPVTGT